MRTQVCRFRARSATAAKVTPAVVAAALAPAADAKLDLRFDRASSRAGERAYLSFGEYFESRDNTVHVYLVRASIRGSVLHNDYGGGFRLGPPPRRAGVLKVGRTLSGRPGLGFVVPRVRAGRYAALLWCSTCRYRQLLASFGQSVPDDAFVRAGRRLLRVVRQRRRRGTRVEPAEKAVTKLRQSRDALCASAAGVRL